MSKSYGSTYMLLTSLLMIVVAQPLPGAELSVDEVLARPEVRSFLADGSLGQPHPEAPAEIAQFGRLVGIWKAQAEMKAQDGSWIAGAEAVWIWKYALGGFATRDLWIHPEDHLPVYLGALGRSYLLTSLRLLEVGTGQWQIAWAANGAGKAGGADFGTFTAKAAGDDMVLTGSSVFGQQRVTFSKITETSFQWLSEYSQDGEAWIAVMRVRAQRKK